MPLYRDHIDALLVSKLGDPTPDVRQRMIPRPALLLAVLLIGSARAVGGAEAVSPLEQVKCMGRGVNILGYDPIWDDAGKGRFKERHFKLIHDAGFQSVRINLHALQRLRADNGYQLGDAWLNTLDWAVKGALANHLMVVLDLHNYTDIARDPLGFKPRFVAYWKQIAAHFRDAPDSVLFEILNEPNGKLTPQLWNEFLREAHGIIRATNPTRTVVVGPPFWNSIDHLDDLALPEDDRNIIVTVHYYKPMKFTHQGARWNKETAHFSGITWGTDEEKRQVKLDFDRVQQWSLAHRRPILLGEFGAYDKAPMESRARYVATSPELPNRSAGRGPTGSSTPTSSFSISTGISGSSQSGERSFLERRGRLEGQRCRCSAGLVAHLLRLLHLFVAASDRKV